MNHAAINILAQILVANQGNRLTDELITGVLTSLNRALEAASSNLAPNAPDPAENQHAE